MLWGIWVFKIYPTQNFSKTFQVLRPIHLLVLGSVLVSSTAQNSSFMRHDSILSLHSHSAFPSPLSTTHPLRIFKNMWVVSPEWLLLLFSHWVMSNSLWPYELQHTRFPCPSLSPRVCSNSCPLNFQGKNTRVGCHFVSREASQPRDGTLVYLSPALAGGFYHWAI